MLKSLDLYWNLLDFLSANSRYEREFRIRNIMNLMNYLLIKLFSKKIGSDQYGNTYYISNIKDYLGKAKRYVLYNGANESSKIPPMWHAWMHYTIDEVPSTNAQKYSWQKNFVPNLSGTNAAYFPRSTVKIQKYLAWRPN